MAITLISTSTISSTTNRWDINSIPGTYTDLMVVGSMRATNAAANVDLVFKLNNSSTGYSQRYLLGNGSTASSGNSTTEPYLVDPIFPGSGNTSNTFGNIVFYFPNYSGSTEKSVSVDGVSESNGSLAYQTIMADKWTGTAAITQLSFWAGDPANPSSGFANFSSISVYGITKGSSGGVTVS